VEQDKIRRKIEGDLKVSGGHYTLHKGITYNDTLHRGIKYNGTLHNNF